MRDPTKDKELTKAVEKAGGKVFKGDIAQPETLVAATENIHTVISALNSTENKIVVDGQINLLNASMKNGVKRFVPSDFGVDYTKFTREELARTAIISPKLTFQEHLDRTSITQLHFKQGALIETFFQLQKQGFGYWGEDNFKLDLTSYDDIARAVAAGVSRPNLSGRFVFIGESLSYK